MLAGRISGTCYGTESSKLNEESHPVNISEPTNAPRLVFVPSVIELLLCRSTTVACFGLALTLTITNAFHDLST